MVHYAKEQTGVVTLVVRCYDFRTIRMTFMNQPFEDNADREFRADGMTM